jgi:hypothetical protein
MLGLCSLKYEHQSGMLTHVKLATHRAAEPSEASSDVFSKNTAAAAHVPALPNSIAVIHEKPVASNGEPGRKRAATHRAEVVRSVTPTVASNHLARQMPLVDTGSVATSRSPKKKPQSGTDTNTILIASAANHRNTPVPRLPANEADPAPATSGTQVTRMPLQCARRNPPISFHTRSFTAESYENVLERDGTF